MTQKSFVSKVGIIASLGFVIVVFQNFSVLTSDGRLSAFPNICHIEPGQSTCSVVLDWTSATSSACLFVRDASGARKTSTCQKQGHINVDYVTERPLTFELRKGSDPASALISSVPVFGIRVSSSTAVRTLAPPEVQKDVVKSTNLAVAASSWDGRLLFSATPTANADRWAWVVTALKPEAFEGKKINEIDLNKSDYYTNRFVLDTDALTPEEIESTRSMPMFDSAGGKDRLGRNEAGIRGRLHLAVYPHPSLHENPFRSDAMGNRSATADYETYRFFIVAAPLAVGALVDTSKTALKPRRFLSIAEAQVVIQSPRTTRAAIVNARIVTPAKELRDVNGEIIIGYEPGVSLDGRLITYSGTHLESTGQQGGFAMYTLNANPNSRIGWSAPMGIAHMYYAHGPGRSGGERMISGLPFSVRFPFAKYPLRDDHGGLFSFDQPIRGSYLWLSPDASDIVMSTTAGLSAARRGTVMIGARTMGKMQLIDGPMNPVRGNPTSNHGIYAGTEEYNSLARAYDEMPLPNAGGLKMKTAFENVLFSMLYFRPGSWDAFGALKKSPFPVGYAREAYGFLVHVGASSRFVEAPVLDLQPDLLLALPMNESLSHDRAFTKDVAYSPIGTFTAASMFSKTVYYDSKTTPDWSPYHQTGVLIGAQFPYEYYDVPNLWNTSRQLKDRSEGAFGNSVFMRPGTYVKVDMSPKAVARIYDNDQYSLSFWFRQTASGSASLVTWPGLLKVASENGAVKVQFSQGTEILSLSTGTDAVRVGRWTHVTLRYQVGNASLFINGELKAESSAARSVAESAESIVQIGPISASSTFRVDMDEVYLYSAKLSEKEILRLAFRREVESEIPGVAAGIARNSSQKDAVAFVPANNPYRLTEAQLGKQLFESPTLSQPQTVSCASCHQASAAFADARPFSIGALGFQTSRNTPALIGPAFMRDQFWDGSAPTLESQVLHPVLAKGEMNLTPVTLLTRLQTAAWSKRFMETYGRAPSLTLAARALASYVRGISSGDSAFDLALRPTPDSEVIDPSLTALTSSQQRGWRLFSGRANCIACHSGPNFTDGKVHDIGLEIAITSIEPQGDLGASPVSGRRSETYAFKTPSLRHVSRTAPYFHEGRMSSLEDVVEFYNRGGDRSADTRSSRSLLIRPLDLTAADKAALVDFLKTLDSDVRDGL